MNISIELHSILCNNVPMNFFFSLIITKQRVENMSKNVFTRLFCYMLELVKLYTIFAYHSMLKKLSLQYDYIIDELVFTCSNSVNKFSSQTAVLK